ncbi:AP2 domain family protein [Babesia bovis T2Bo]|uniref:AP2/ERF domain-containing protein n=1 Tax=Babesia bovis TaxID=5865 RepID=A7AN06_BABBO|nr:AP2 domain family protein [Babesia bovis T2Bo]EDO07940.1 AP2 domain family protein [Babesia bovis T2Bo]|eukprot:XP_001611508.1 hypothetical protein [Babesia bovis T2Bo]
MRCSQSRGSKRAGKTRPIIQDPVQTPAIEDNPVNPAPVKRRRNESQRPPPNMALLPDVPEEDYHSLVRGVYYHHTKLEWRATCRDPFNCSKRSQRTFGVRKYGFYEAKMRAEVAADEWDKHRQLLNILHTITPSNKKRVIENIPYLQFHPYGNYPQYYDYVPQSEAESSTCSHAVPLYSAIANQLMQM